MLAIQLTFSQERDFYIVDIWDNFYSFVKISEYFNSNLILLSLHIKKWKYYFYGNLKFIAFMEF